LAAVLPGAGHLYVGRPPRRNVVLSQRAFHLGAVAAFTHDSPVLGGILLFFELVVPGGIRSAAAAAREVTRRMRGVTGSSSGEHCRLSLGVSPAGSGAVRLRLDLWTGPYGV